MQKNEKPEVCVSDIVGGIVRGMRRRGLPANIDHDDLQQEGEIAVFQSGVTEPAALVAKIARDAMLNKLKTGFRDARIFTGLNYVVDTQVDSSGNVVGRKRSYTTDPFFSLIVDDYRPEKQRIENPIRTLASRHAEWERERAERWA